jgi:hypothetical protein
MDVCEMDLFGSGKAGDMGRYGHYHLSDLMKCKEFVD